MKHNTEINDILLEDLPVSYKLGVFLLGLLLTVLVPSILWLTRIKTEDTIRHIHFYLLPRGEHAINFISHDKSLEISKRSSLNQFEHIYILREKNNQIPLKISLLLDGDSSLFVSKKTSIQDLLLSCEFVYVGGKRISPKDTFLLKYEGCQIPLLISSIRFGVNSEIVVSAYVDLSGLKEDIHVPSYIPEVQIQGIKEE